MTSDDISFMSENIMNLRWPRTVPATFQERATVTGSCTTRFHIEIRGDAFLANLSSASLSLCVFLLFGLWISGCISVANWERHEMFDLQENCGGYTVNRESTAVLQLIRRWSWWLMMFIVYDAIVSFAFIDSWHEHELSSTRPYTGWHWLVYSNNPCCWGCNISFCLLW